MIKKILDTLLHWWRELTGGYKDRIPQTSVIKAVPKIRDQKRKPKAIVGALIRRTAGGNHAWYESNIGLIRKPII